MRELIDIQSERDDRGVRLDEVGVSELRYPIRVAGTADEPQPTVATIAMAVRLDHDTKGTHMSRFIEALEAHRDAIALATLPALLDDLRTRLRADRATIDIAFPYFVERRAPVSGLASRLEIECRLRGVRTDDAGDVTLEVRVPATSLCPCSKAISDYGAHNQRGYVTIAIRQRVDEARPLDIDDLVAIADEAASCRIYPLLKRVDERAVTMAAFDNPKFVEDIARDVAAALRDDRRVEWFGVRVENHESIHAHNAFAATEWARVPSTPAPRRNGCAPTAATR